MRDGAAVDVDMVRLVRTAWSCRLSSAGIGFLIAVMLAVTIAWIWFRGGQRLLTWPVKILFAILAAAALALMLGF